MSYKDNKNKLIARYYFGLETESAEDIPDFSAGGEWADRLFDVMLDKKGKIVLEYINYPYTGRFIMAISGVYSGSGYTRTEAVYKLAHKIAEVQLNARFDITR